MIRGGHESKGLLSMTQIDWTIKHKATAAAHAVMNVLQDLDISLGHFLSTILAPDADQLRGKSGNSYWGQPHMASLSIS